MQGEMIDAPAPAPSSFPVLALSGLNDVYSSWGHLTYTLVGLLTQMLISSQNTPLSQTYSKTVCCQLSILWLINTYNSISKISNLYLEI